MIHLSSYHIKMLYKVQKVHWTWKWKCSLWCIAFALLKIDCHLINRILINCRYLLSPDELLFLFCSIAFCILINYRFTLSSDKLHLAFSSIADRHFHLMNCTFECTRLCAAMCEAVLINVSFRQIFTTVSMIWYSIIWF